MSRRYSTSRPTGFMFSFGLFPAIGSTIIHVPSRLRDPGAYGLRSLEDHPCRAGNQKSNQVKVQFFDFLRLRHLESHAVCEPVLLSVLACFFN